MFTCAVGLLVLPLHPLHVDQFDLEEELAHLRYPIGSGGPSEAVQVVPGEDEVPLLPAAEEFVALLPQEASLYRMYWLLSVVAGKERLQQQRETHVSC